MNNNLILPDNSIMLNQQPVVLIKGTPTLMQSPEKIMEQQLQLIKPIVQISDIPLINYSPNILLDSTLTKIKKKLKKKKNIKF